ncbi:MAG: cell envelope integrity protein TolA [Nitrospiraceae bacterium]|nr:MAG: cell envelope integrity protein TolA [Nitrospiraceae bacterium]
MKYALHIGKEPNFQAVVIASAVIHLVLVALIVIPLKTKGDEYRSYFVDLVGPLETRTENTASYSSTGKGGEREAVAIKEPSAQSESKADMSLESERVAKEIDRIRSISALSKQKNKKEEERYRDIEIIRQNIHGSAVKNTTRGAGSQSPAPDSYYALVTRRIWSEWVYPDFGSSGLEVIISMKIEKDGKIISCEIEKPSGNPLFDRSAVKAVAKADPLPPPPYEMEIGVRFYL